MEVFSNLYDLLTQRRLNEEEERLARGCRTAGTKMGMADLPDQSQR